jgi:hypothetical protein
MKAASGKRRSNRAGGSTLRTSWKIDQANGRLIKNAQEAQEVLLGWDFSQTLIATRISFMRHHLP